jgi:GT2 family glycosyltransferase
MADCVKTESDHAVFITVNYNNVAYTLKYIDSILNQRVSGTEPEIIIVDNNSNRNDMTQLDTIKAKNVRILKNDQNLGYFKALNIGIAFAMDNLVNKAPCTRNHIVVSNNDVEFDSRFMGRLSEMEYSGDTLAVAPNVISSDGYNENPHCIRRLSRLRKLGYRVYVSNYYLGKALYWFVQKLKNIRGPRKNDQAGIPQFIYMGIGACYILTEHFFRHFSRLDDRVFLWGEEALLAGQIASVGGRIWYEPGLVLHHKESSTVSRVPSRQAYDIWKESFRIYSKYL